MKFVYLNIYIDTFCKILLARSIVSASVLAFTNILVSSAKRMNSSFLETLQRSFM